MNSLYAGLWARVLAFAWDYLLIAAYLVVLTAGGLAVNLMWPALTQGLFANSLIAHLVSFLLITLPVSLYFALGEASRGQATWGKRKIGLRVVRTDGTPLNLARSFGRTALKFIPWELAHTLIWQVRFGAAAQEALINAGFLLVWALVAANLVSLVLSKTHQTLYDWLAGTCIIRC